MVAWNRSKPNKRGVLRLSLLAGVLLFAGATEARVHALVVGIDKYQHLPPLAGAVNDARDIAGALQAIADSKVTMLLNDDADYATIRQHWFAMLDRADRGDTVVFSYAGHGSRVPEQVLGSEADGKDDVFVLAGFDPNQAKSPELIRDNQLFEWFKAAEGRGVQLLFVADSCHSGTMTRAVDARLGFRQTRQVNIDFEAGLAEDMTVELAADVAQFGRSDLPYLTFLSAGLETQQIPEVTIKSVNGNTNTRGALSFVLARALEGEADSDGDKVLTREELRHYVIANVQVLSERQQTPELSPLAQPKQPVLTLTEKSTPLPVIVPEQRYAVFVEGVDSEQKKAMLAALPSLSWAADVGAAEFYWDEPSGELLSTAGDLLATGLSLSKPLDAQARLRGVFDKRSAMQVLHLASRPKMLKTSLQPGAVSQAKGQLVEPTFHGQHGEYLLVLNLAGDGTVQLVYPLSEYGDPLRHGLRPWSLALQVADPLGEDHMVALAFKEPQPELLLALELLNGTRSPLQVAALLMPYLKARTVEVGLLGMFSRP